MNAVIEILLDIRLQQVQLAALLLAGGLWAVVRRGRKDLARSG